MEYRHQDINYRKDSKCLRIMVGIGLPLAGLLAAYLFWRYDPSKSGNGIFYLFCPFNRLTGLYCPVCGMTRAIHELLHFNVIQAVRDNAIVVLVFGPGAAYYGFREYIHYLLDYRFLPALQLRHWMIVTLSATVILFTVLRNIPIIPFCYLTPIA